MTKRPTSVVVAVLAVAVVVGAAGHAGAASGDDARGHWSGGTAYTMPQGRWERGISMPLRWAMTDDIEWTVYALAAPLVPNARIEVGWIDRERAALSTVHALAYPTPLLNVLARSGTGGVLPATSTIPPMLTVRNGVELTSVLGGEHMLTAGFYVSTTPRFAEADFPTIDLPIVYPRTASYHTGATVRQRLDAQGPIAGGFEYRATADFFGLPGTAGPVAFEHTGRVAWAPGPKFRAMIGYMVSFGAYPFGTMWRAYPLLDVQFAWGGASES